MTIAKIFLIEKLIMVKKLTSADFYRINVLENPYKEGQY